MARKYTDSPKELKFKMEPTCAIDEQDPPRSDWPPHIDPWWKPIDRLEKPPYSYATLIAHALLSSKDGRLTLSEIYTWISENYPYFQQGEKSWQNSIRHNLSVYRDWFRRVDRRPTPSQPGKGGYWQVEMHMEKIFIDNLCQVGGYGRKLPSMRIGRAAGENVFSLKEKYTNILVMRPEDFKTVKKSLRIKNERPSVKKGKRQDGSHSTKSKAKDGKRSTVVPQTIDHCLSEPLDSSLFDLWMYDESRLFNDYTYLMDSSNEATASVTKVIDLQSVSMEKNLHFSTAFSVDEFTDPASKMFIPDFDSYQTTQYVDPCLTINQLNEDSIVDSYCSDQLFNIDFLEFL